MESFIDSYSYFAPVAIYLILTPTLTKLFLSEARGKNFAKYTIKWFVVARMIACVYGVIWTAIAFGLPLYSEVNGLSEAIKESLSSLVWMLTHSVYFYAVYASAITVFIACRIPNLAKNLAKGVDLIEYMGQFLIPVIPFLMMAIGAYVTILPEVLEKALGSDVDHIRASTVSILGFPVDITTSLGMVLLYVLGALLTGFVSALWHIGLLILVKRAKPAFSLIEYFSV